MYEYEKREWKKAPFFTRSDTWALGFGFWKHTDGEPRGFELYLGNWVLCFFDEV